MKRIHIVLAAVGVLALVLAIVVTAFARKVDVRTGEIVECTYGHVVSEDVETIKVPARDASKYGVKTSRIVCDDHKRAEQSYSQAQQAIADNDLKTAEKKLAEVVAIDAAYRRAKSQLDEIASGKKPTAESSGGVTNAGGTDSGGTGGTSSGDNGGTTKPSTPGDDANPTGPVASLAGWMPDVLPGYSSDKPIADAMAMSREYVPSGGGKADVLVIAAEQVGTTKESLARLQKEVELPYSTGGKKVEVNGRTGYVGTDGGRYATLGLVDGPVFVVLQASSDSVEPSKLAAELLEIAKGLPK